MAMIQCPECGKDISNNAKSCPNCGYSFAKKNSGLSIVAFVLSFLSCTSLISFVLGLCDLIFGSPKEKHTLSGWACAIAVVTTIIGIIFVLMMA